MPSYTKKESSVFALPNKKDYLNNNVCCEAYRYIKEMEYFVDKTDILTEIFPILNTENRYVCITRPRRFGKTAAACLSKRLGMP